MSVDLCDEPVVITVSHADAGTSQNSLRPYKVIIADDRRGPALRQDLGRPCSVGHSDLGRRARHVICARDLVTAISAGEPGT